MTWGQYQNGRSMVDIAQAASDDIIAIYNNGDMEIAEAIIALQAMADMASNYDDAQPFLRTMEVIGETPS